LMPPYQQLERGLIAAVDEAFQQFGRWRFRRIGSRMSKLVSDRDSTASPTLGSGTAVRR
jgi:hypothetical protein